jgi:hypothetical protein
MTREELIDAHRYINVAHCDWWADIYEDMQTKLDDVGFEVDNFYWTGFWSQGDGACFEGHVRSTPKFFHGHFTKEQFPWTAQFADMGGFIDVTVRHQGPYYHEHSARINVDIEAFADICTLDELEQAAAAAWDEHLTAEFAAFEKAVEEVLRGYMKELYRKLQKEHDYLTSDEVVGEYVDHLMETEVKAA